ncbi:MAG: hypothetical protein ACRDV8_06215, partial [Acidimicrobiales bacterium]
MAVAIAVVVGVLLLLNAPDAPAGNSGTASAEAPGINAASASLMDLDVLPSGDRTAAAGLHLV